ncbi:hypothetical protein E6H22_05715 [Candidatus Bathyarchaeota archaeon]|nr:MAG: hypothetical protein E6H22_05715 [Candidatus Bathyarchaeota archaeon]
MPFQFFGGGLASPNAPPPMSAERFQLSKTGQLQFSHPAGTHDDRLWAFALAIYASRFETPKYDPVAALSRNPNSLMPNIDWRQLIPGGRPRNTPRPGDPPGVMIHGQTMVLVMRESSNHAPAHLRQTACKQRS